MRVRTCTHGMMQRAAQAHGRQQQQRGQAVSCVSERYESLTVAHALWRVAGVLNEATGTGDGGGGICHAPSPRASAGDSGAAHDIRCMRAQRACRARTRLFGYSALCLAPLALFALCQKQPYI